MNPLVRWMTINPRYSGIRISRRLLFLALVLYALHDSQAQQNPPAAPSYPDHTNLMVVRDASGQERPVKTPADWAIRRGHILAHLQEVMGPLPEKKPGETSLKVVSSRREPRYLLQKVSIASEPGDRVPAWLLIPHSVAASKHGAPGMLCLHQTVAIGKDEPAGLGTNPDLDYARELAERGYVTIAPDYPNFGEYKLDVYAKGYASASMKAIWNNMRAVDVLQGLDQVDPERIGAIGHSLGGHNAIFTALFDPRIKVVVSSCGFNAFPYYFKGNISGWSHKGYMPRLKDRYGLDLKRVPFDWPELIGALAPRPFFTNSPLHDDNFEVEGVRVCLAAARPIYQLLGARDRIVAVHLDAAHSFPASSREAAYAFVDDVLKKTNAPRTP
jgi:pimeloyl-ACP methyl ester carboxylesterase